MPKPFSEREKKLIDERLRQQAYKKFTAPGLKKTSIEELARAAGISKAAFYIFYPSKEALFMDLVEEAERVYRRDVLEEIERPGPTPRSRLAAVFKKAFSLWKTIPLLQFFTREDYNLIFHRVSPEMLAEHLRADRDFIRDLVTRCQGAGIPIRVPPEEIDRLMHALFFIAMHEDDFGADALGGALDVLLELVAAYCLGEIEVAIPNPERYKQNEFNH